MTKVQAESSLELVPPGDWRAYEAYVAGALAAHFGATRFEQNVRLPGKISGTPRQVDVLAHTRPVTAIECKYVGRKIDVPIVDAFVGMLLDVGLVSGLIVTAKGFTAAAGRRAQTDDLGVHLAIIAPNRHSDHQHRRAPLIWHDAIGVSLGLIDNWLCDLEGSGEPGQALMMMYPLGHSRASAMKAAPIVYANFLARSLPDVTLRSSPPRTRPCLSQIIRIIFLNMNAGLLPTVTGLRAQRCYAARAGRRRSSARS